MSNTATPIRIERKVVASTVMALLASGAVAVLSDQGLMSAIPEKYQPFVAIIVPTLLTFLGGFLAKHSLRDDLTELAREVGFGDDSADAVVVSTTQVALDPEVTDLDDDGADSTEGLPV